MVIQCRACLNSKDTAFIRMESHIAEGIDFFSCFSVCTQLDAGFNDGLPAVLCTNCSQDLQIAFNFVQTARQADRMLRDSLLQKLMPNEIVETLDTEVGDSIMEPLEVVDDSEDEDCVVEELLEDEPVLDEVIEEGDVEIMEVEKADEHIFENSVDELELIEEKYEETPTVESVNDINYQHEEQPNSGEYFPEDEVDDEYQREYHENEEQLNICDTVSNGAKWKCIECKRVLCGNVSYEGHMNMHRSLRPYKCTLCMCAFRCKNALEQHTQKRHQPENTLESATPISNCDKCPKIFSTREELQEHHELVHPESYPVQCRRCPLIQPLTRSKLVEHFRIEHPVEHRKHFPTVGRPLNEPIKPTPWQCEVCKRYMRSEAALRDHRHTHRNERPHECQFCSKRFATTSNLRQHMRGVHTEEYEKQVNEGGDTVVQCEICKKQLLRRNLEKHMALHIKKEREANETQAKFLCAYCSREFTNAKSLSLHEHNVHLVKLEEPKYECGICKRKCYQQRDLSSHMQRVHLAERKHVCNICGNAFKSAWPLTTHKLLHVEDKSFECIHCQRKYTRQADLNVHIRSHTGELPYACHLCDKRFAIKVRLTYHLQRHQGVKHPCTYCGNVYDNRNQLKEHLFKHTGMPYRCELCPDVGFTRRLRFSSHMQRVHNQKLSADELASVFAKYTGKAIHFNSSFKAQDSEDSQTLPDCIVDDVKGKQGYVSEILPCIMGKLEHYDEFADDTKDMISLVAVVDRDVGGGGGGGAEKSLLPKRTAAAAAAALPVPGGAGGIKACPPVGPLPPPVGANAVTVASGIIKDMVCVKKLKMDSPLNPNISFEETRCCRACLSVATQNELEDYVDLLEPYSCERGTLTLLDSFNKCTQLHIVVEDFDIEGYPPSHFICGRCRLDLRQAYEFLTRAQLNNQLLKSQYIQLKSEVAQQKPDLNGIYTEREGGRENDGMEKEFLKTDFSPVEYADQSSNITTEIDEIFGDVNSEANEPLPTTLISVERVLCNEQDDAPNSNINTTKESIGIEKLKSSIFGKLSPSDREDVNIDDTRKDCFDFKCEFCTSIFEFQRDLLHHYEIDHGDKTLNFPCEYCQNRFVTKNALRLHRRQVHQKDEYMDCEHCGRTVLKTFYSVHLRRHKQLKFLCNKCPKICASRYTLKKHMELHSEDRDRNIECIDCGRRFYTLENLQLHQTIHISPEDRTIFECTVCSKTFMRKSNLGLHMQMHRGKTMDCPHCGKKFVRRKDLEIHIRFHTGEFPYACSMCDRKFAIKGHLNYHEKRHLGVRYKCDECEKTFINLAGLRQHQYEHTGMPLMCGVCQRGFPTKFKVRRHLRTVHQYLFKKTGYSDTLAKKYITPATKSKLPTKSVEVEDVTEGTVEMLEEHAEDIPLNMLAI
ncbi:uncharacterized protein LOC128857451 [Anastrepha ludens]|uniref:uncharacterized protein LOC128857451 n=1 Tax=Anastrepha ludens TaxID=28586 RepID=UPI0023AEA74F|nr:uncharacterized protein LOC128857451 [Anastrepha ludens]